MEEPKRRNTNNQPASKKLVIPAETLELLRAGMLNEIGIIGSRIAEITEPGSENDLHQLLQALQDLDDFRVLFAAAEAKGRSTLELNLAAYGHELAQAIESELSAQRDLLDVNPDLDGAQRQRQKAQWSITLLQALLDHASSYEGDEQGAQQEEEQ